MLDQPVLIRKLELSNIGPGHNLNGRMLRNVFWWRWLGMGYLFRRFRFKLGQARQPFQFKSRKKLYPKGLFPQVLKKRINSDERQFFSDDKFIQVPLLSILFRSVSRIATRPNCWIFKGLGFEVCPLRRNFHDLISIQFWRKSVEGLDQLTNSG